jgi:Skp family chaperone for outer membrane proteins
MRTLRAMALGSFFFAVFALSVSAQTAAPGRLYFINPNFFGDEKAGITKFIAGLNLLNKEFANDQTELQAAAQKIQALGDEIKVMQQQATGGKIPVDQNALRAKADEYDRLQRAIKFKQEDAKARFDKREAAVMGPIRQDIGKAMQDFAKKNGYWMILDASKMDDAGLFLTFDEAADVTKPFIAFYNARP